MTIEDIVEKFNTTPFLFVGSGVTRRYLDLPDWRGLLEHFANEISNDDFAYSSYENQASKYNCPAGIMPKVAELIQNDYDGKWFSTPSIRTVDESVLEKIHNGLSPFKAEIAAYVQRNSKCNDVYKNEIKKISEVSEKSISGVITTNYDTFLEDHFQGYTKYIGQNQLIFSAIQGVAEIYKIHGSIEDPDSIVINEQDYLNFEKRSAYLAAKLMTIFMEYPIIFIGYSISDSNILNIIKSIVNCLDIDQIKMLENRFIFVEYKEGMIGAEVTPYTIMIDGKPLAMKKITLDDFMLLYKALEDKRAKLPVRILRRFKQEIYNYTLTNEPTANLRVASIDDARVSDDELVLAIGKISDFGLKGLSGIDANEWYRNIIMNDLDFTADELLKYAFPKLLKQNSGKLPVNKYLSIAKEEYPDCVKIAEEQNFENIISNTIKAQRKCLGEYSSVSQIWVQERSSIEKATRLISHLKENQIDIVELEGVLREIFENDVNVLQHSSPAVRTNIRRLIRILDYLKWGNKRTF